MVTVRTPDGGSYKMPINKMVVYKAGPPKTVQRYTVPELKNLLSGNNKPESER